MPARLRPLPDQGPVPGVGRGPAGLEFPVGVLPGPIRVSGNILHAGCRARLHLV